MLTLSLIVLTPYIHTHIDLRAVQQIRGVACGAPRSAEMGSLATARLRMQTANLFFDCRTAIKYRMFP